MPEETGLGPYQAGGGTRAKASPRTLAEMIKRKIAMKAELALMSAQIQEGVALLDEHGAQDLVQLLTEHESTVDQDIEALRQEAERRAREEAAARHVKAMTVPLSKSASPLLQAEAERRVALGTYPSAQVLITEAIKQVFGTH